MYVKSLITLNVLMPFIIVIPLPRVFIDIMGHKSFLAQCSRGTGSKCSTILVVF